MRGLTLFLTLLINVVYVLAGAVYKVVNIGANSSLNIRNGPGLDKKVVGSLHNNDLIYAISVADGWAKFYKGYVSTKYLKKATGPVKYETTENLNFRKGPATNYKIFDTLKKGTVVNYYGRDPFNNNWAVTGKGYANVPYLKKHSTTSTTTTTTTTTNNNNSNNSNKKNKKNNNNNNKSGKKSAKLKKAEAASDYARNHAKPSSTGWCARYVADSLENAGFSFTRQGSACLYHSNGILKGMGFTEISKPKKLKKGDVAVHECNQRWEFGHIQIYDGNKWYSDFVQSSENIYHAYIPPIHYYRILN